MACEPWPLDATCCDGWDEIDPDVQRAATQRAVDLIWMLSGRRFGLCQVTVRPCPRRCAPPPPTWWAGVGWYPAVVDGAIVNVSACGCRTRCACTPYSAVVLEPGPVTSITEVRIDGTVLDPAAYLVLDARELVRTDGGQWPGCQRLDQPDGAADTWTVTYTYGLPVPAGGQAAASVLACELAKACTGAGRCRLPNRVQQITRDGVSMTLLDPMEFLDKGRIGLPEIDAWLAAVNPNALPEAPRVLSPDLPPRGRQVTWTAPP